MIYINDKIRICELDDKNLQIEELVEVNKKQNGIKTGEIIQRWEKKGYYSTLQSAIKGILNKKLFDSVEQGVELCNLVKYIECAIKEIENAFK